MDIITFLLVDDDPTSNMIAEFNIKKTVDQVEVKVFSRPEMALDYIQNNTAYLKSLSEVYLLTDLNMPGMNGKQLLHRLYDNNPELARHLRIYILSAGEMSLTESDVQPLVQGSLLKPLNATVIQEVLKTS